MSLKQKFKVDVSFIFLTILILVISLGTKAKEISSSETFLNVFDYKQIGRMSNSGRWYNYILSEDTCSSGTGFDASHLSPPACFNWLSEKDERLESIVSEGPWWIDPNHMHLDSGNGIGLVNVIAFTKLPSNEKVKSVNLTNKKLQFTASFKGQLISNTKGFADLESVNSSHIYFWFQTAPREVVGECEVNEQLGENCTRQSDFILTGDFSSKYELELAKENTEYSFTLTPELGWSCLGAGSNQKYDCMDIEDALKDVSVVGFLAAPVEPCANKETCSLNRGKFEFSNFKISTNISITSNVSLVRLDDKLRLKKAQWNKAQYSSVINFKNGDGIRLTVSDKLGFIRLGLMPSNTKKKKELDSLVTHLYLESSLDSQGSIYVAKHKELDKLAQFQTGDVLGIYYQSGFLYYTRNNEILYQDKVASCKDSCSLTPFVGGYINRNPVPIYIAHRELVDLIDKNELSSYVDDLDLLRLPMIESELLEVNKWNMPIKLPHQPLQNGSGIEVVTDDAIGYFRLGLTTEETPLNSLDSIESPHLYLYKTDDSEGNIYLARNDNVKLLSTYKANDSVGVYFYNNTLLYSKNGHILYERKLDKCSNVCEASAFFGGLLFDEMELVFVKPTA